MSSSPLLELPTELLQQIVDECDPGSHFPLAVSCRRCFAVTKDLLTRHRKCFSRYGAHPAPWTMANMRKKVSDDPIAAWHIRNAICYPEHDQILDDIRFASLCNLRQVTVAAHDSSSRQPAFTLDVRFLIPLIALPALKKLSIAVVVNYDPQQNDICISHGLKLIPSSSMEHLHLADIDFSNASQSDLDPSGFLHAAFAMAPALLTMDVICSAKIADRILQCLPGSGAQKWHSQADGSFLKNRGDCIGPGQILRWFWARDWNSLTGQKSTETVSKPVLEAAHSWGAQLAWLKRLKRR